jgi:hypothetical protein
VKLSFEEFAAVVFRVHVFWILTLCSVVVVNQRFRGPCCLNQHFTLKMEAA